MASKSGKSKAKSFLSRVVSKAKQVASNFKTGWGVVKDAVRSFKANLPRGSQLGSAYTAVSGLGNAFSSARNVLTGNTGLQVSLNREQSKRFVSAFSPASQNNPKPTGGDVMLGPMTRTISGGISNRGGSTAPVRFSYDTSSPAFDTGYGLNESDIASMAQPRTYTINSESLGSGGETGGVSGTSSVMPSAPSTPNYANDIAFTNASLGIGTPQPTTDQTAENPQSSFDAYLKQQQKDQSQYEKDTAKALKQAREDAGIAEAQQRVQNTQNQINAITANMNADLLRLRGTAAREGVTEAVYGGQQAEVTREATIKLLPLQAQLAADQGNLEQAEDNLNTLYSLYSKQVESRYNFRKEVVKSSWEFFNEKEKRQLAEQDKKDEFKKDYFNTQNNFLNQQTFEALKYGKETGSWSLYNNLSRLRLPTNYTSPDWERQMQNVMNDASKVMAKYGGNANVTGADAPLYSGLNSATATAVRGVVNGFKSEPIITNFTQIQEGYNFAKSISNKTKNPADDQALIYSLAKALDPGSVVREGEYATAQKYSQSWVAAYGKGITQALNGTGFLSEQARKNIKSTIETKYKSSLNSYNNLQNQYANQIDNLTGRSNGNEFLRDYRVAMPNQQTVSQSQSDIFDSVVSGSSGGYWSNLWSAITGK